MADTYWVRWRTKWAGGPGEWEDPKFVMTNMSIGEYMSSKIYDINEDYNWSDHYRGVEWECVTPTDRDIFVEVSRANGEIAYAQAKLSILDKLMRQRTGAQ